MSKPTESLMYIVTGFVSAGSVGYVVLQVAGFFLAGLLGAVGAWVAKEFVIPSLNRWFKK